jgi:hypothetical protein
VIASPHLPVAGTPKIGIGGRVAPPPPSRPGELHPEPLTEPDVNLSAYPARATPERLPPCGKTVSSSGFPVDSISPGVTCPLRSTGVTPVRRYYEAVRPCRCFGTFGLVGRPLVPFPLPSPPRFSSSVRKPGLESRPLYTGHRTASK